MAKSDGKHHTTKKDPSARAAAKRKAREEAAITEVLTGAARRLTIRVVPQNRGLRG